MFYYTIRKKASESIIYSSDSCLEKNYGNAKIHGINLVDLLLRRPFLVLVQ